jgi:phosphatidylserine/phosphatidylglycerophosphate/cardiolipin synthase-like enzyme
MIVNACFFLLQIFAATNIHTHRNSQDWADVQAKTGSMLTLINHAEVSKDLHSFRLFPTMDVLQVLRIARIRCFQVTVFSQYFRAILEGNLQKGAAKEIQTSVLEGWPRPLLAPAQPACIV